MNEPTLPYTTEPIESMHARFPAALIRVFDITRGIPSPRPGELRDHVFDFENGVRLIVSKDRVREHEVVLHLSASARPESPVWKKFVPRDPRAFRHFALECFHDIAGREPVMEFYGRSPKGVMHWFGKLEDPA